MIKNVSGIIVENIRTCNLHCKYCFPEQMWDREGRGGQMDSKIYYNIIDTVCKNNNMPTIAIHFAGGEPLLAGVTWFEMAFEVCNEMSKRYDKQFKYSIQTNATLLSPRFIDILRKNKVGIGVSIDGPPVINDEIRGQTNLVLKGLDNIINNLGYTPGVIVVVSRMNVDRISEVMRFLNDLRILEFRANLMGADTDMNGQFMPSAEQWVKCQETICEEIIANRGKIMEYNISQKILKFVRCLLEGISPFTDSSDTCSNAICGAGSRLLYFDSNGNSYPCARSVIDQNTCFGNANVVNFEEKYSQMIIDLNQSMKLKQICSTCPAQIACDYGCHAWNNGKFFQVNCDSTKDLFSWFSTNLDQVARIYTYIRKRQFLRKDSVKNFEGFELSEGSIKNFTNVLKEKLIKYNSRKDLQRDNLLIRYH